VLGRPFKALGRLVWRRRWALLIACVLLACVLWFVGPHLSAAYHLWAGRSDLERYRTPQAREHLEACVRVWPGNITARQLAARAARRAGDLEAARDHLRECQRLEPSPSDGTVLELTLLRASAGELDQVEDYLRQRAAKDGALAPLVWEALAQGCMRTYRLRDAMAYLSDWTDAQPDNIQALFLRGAVREKVGAVTQAVEDFRRVVQLEPERDDARRQLGRCLLKAGRFEDAVTELEGLRKRDPTDRELSANVARCRLEMGQYQEARSILDAVLTQNPDYSPALENRGRLALREGKPGEAEEWLRKAVRVAPFDFQVNWQLGEALRQQEKTADAQEQFEKAHEIQDVIERLGAIGQREMSAHPHDPALHYEMGKLLARIGQKETARYWYESALHQDQHFAPAHVALAEWFEEQGNAAQAAFHREQAKSVPTSSDKP
jgi:tetratricopeptide (TPR) repeat protein